MEFHEVRNLRVGFDLSGCFRGLPPGGMFSWGFPSSSFPRISLVFGRVASLLVADEAFAVPDMLCPLGRREMDFVYIHGVWVRPRGLVS